MSPLRVIEDIQVLPRSRWSGVVQQGEVLRIVDLEGQQAVDFLCYDAQNTSERYDSTVTSRIAARTYIKKGDILYSNLAHPLMTVINDTVGWHDTIAGCCSPEINRLRYGESGNWSCRQNFLALAAENDLTERDIVANVNFFMYVPVDSDSQISIKPSASKAGDYVELRAERDVLVLISNCPQELNPANGFKPTSIMITRFA